MFFLFTCAIEFVLIIWLGGIPGVEQIQQIFIFYLIMSLGLLIFISGALLLVRIGDECDGDKKNK